MKLVFILGFYITVTGFCYCQETLPSNYDSLVKSADSLLNKENYSEALKDYETAYNIQPSQELFNIIAETKEKFLKQKKFNELIQTADSLYRIKEYIDAKELYMHALEIKCNHIYPMHRIEEIDMILKKEEE